MLELATLGDLLVRAGFHDDDAVAAGALGELVERCGGESAAVDWINAGPGQRLLPALVDRPELVGDFGVVAEAAVATAAGAWGFNERTCDQIRPFVEACATEGITLLALKGMGLLGSAYPDPGTRFVGDADLYVPLQHAPAASAIASRLGWGGPESGWHWYSPGLTTQALYGPGGGAIDLHHRPGRAFAHAPHRYAPMATTAQRLAPTHPLADSALWAPDSDWQLLVVATHAANPVNRHVFHVVADVHRLVTRTPVQPDRVAALAATCGVTLRVRAALADAAAVLDTPFDLSLLTPPSTRAATVERRAIAIEAAMANQADTRRVAPLRRLVMAAAHGAGGVRPWAAARVAAAYVGNGTRQRRYRQRAGARLSGPGR